MPQQCGSKMSSVSRIQGKCDKGPCSLKMVDYEISSAYQ